MNQYSRKLHVAVVGAGLIGLTTALALRQQGLQVTLVERGTKPAYDAAIGLRVSALNHRSRALLQQLQVWQQLPESRLGPYTGMEVWEHDSFARIVFEAQQIGTDDLGAIVENQVLEQHLWQQAEASGVTLLAQHQLQQWQPAEDTVTLQLVDAQEKALQLQVDYVIAADGANSQLRRWAELPLTFWDYEQQGLVAVVETECPHAGVARQSFLNSGPLALLPLADPQQVSIVWSCDEERAQELMALAKEQPEAFRRQLQTASNNALGTLKVVSDVVAFPLRMQYAQQWVQQRLILVGDAAHSIHPLAGQGANLGFADVAALQRAFAADNEKALGRQLLGYQRERKAAAVTMIAAMEGFKRGFGTPNPLLKLARGLGFTLADNLTPMKKLLTKVALGD